MSEAEKSQIIFLNVIDAIALDSEQSLFRRLRLLTTKGAARVEKSQKNESTDKRFLRSLRFDYRRIFAGAEAALADIFERSRHYWATNS